MSAKSNTKVEEVISVASSELHTVAKLTENVEDELEQDDPTAEHARAILEDNIDN